VEGVGFCFFISYDVLGDSLISLLVVLCILAFCRYFSGILILKLKYRYQTLMLLTVLFISRNFITFVCGLQWLSPWLESCL